MISFTPDNINRPAFVTVQVSLASSGGIMGSQAIATGPGTLISVKVVSASSGATVFAFDNATTPSGPTVPVSDGAATPLNAGVRIVYNRPFNNGLTVGVIGTLTAVVTYYPG